MEDAGARELLNGGALVAMASLFVWLVKVVVNDMRHDVREIKRLLAEIREALRAWR